MCESFVGAFFVAVSTHLLQSTSFAVRVYRAQKPGYQSISINVFEWYLNVLRCRDLTLQPIISTNRILRIVTKRNTLKLQEPIISHNIAWRIVYKATKWSLSFMTFQYKGLRAHPVHEEPQQAFGWASLAHDLPWTSAGASWCLWPLRCSWCSYETGQSAKFGRWCHLAKD